MVARAASGEMTMSRLDSLRLMQEREKVSLSPHRVMMSRLDSLRLRQAVERRRELGIEQALERDIVPEEYVVGPGDELILTLWGEISQSFLLTVTPEGRVLVPHVGDISVGQLTLAQAKERIVKEVGKRYKSVTTSVSLSKVRDFRVFLVGAVNLPGTYSATAVDRVSMLVDQAGGFSPGASRRNVQIKRRDSAAITADLYRFSITGDLADNPYLRDGDVVAISLCLDSVGVFGAVGVEGYYELKQGDQVSDLLDLARGLVSDVYMEKAELVRFREDQQIPDRIFIDLTEAVVEKNPEHNLVLQSDDVLLVRRIPGWHPEHLVEVRGEVLFPGHYTIKKDKTSLSEVIERAGGFKPDASLSEAKLIRTLYDQTLDLEFERLKQMNVSDMNDEEYAYFKTKSSQLHGVVLVDFQKLFLRDDKSKDVLLKHGDIVNVPAVRRTVNVSGQVKEPGAVQYKPGEKTGYYIDQAGGYNWNARKSKVRVIKGSTAQWLKPSKVKRIEPGDTIWVPERPKKNYWELFKDFVSTTAQVATVILVVDQLRR